MKDGMGSSQMIVLVARKEFLAQHRAALDDFFEDMVRGIHWMLTPANRQAAIELAASVAKQPASLLEPFFLTKKDSYRDPDGIPDLAALQRNIETQAKFGFLKQSFDVRQYADLSFIQRAAHKVETAAR
jgi:ABC-type nitrate/sulfonate/bicarbonate transport system substrate-binding protein